LGASERDVRFLKVLITKQIKPNPGRRQAQMFIGLRLLAPPQINAMGR
jgi:hypothetical protein